MKQPAESRRTLGGLDRVGRVVVALALLAFGYRNRESTIGSLAFVGVADPLSTAVIGRRPLNALFGIDTRS